MQPGLVDEQTAGQFEQVRELVRAIRATRSEFNVPPARYLPAMIAAGRQRDFLEEQREILAFLARLDNAELVISETAEAPEKAVTLVQGSLTCYLPLAGLVDLDAERERLQKELADVQAQIQRVQGLLNSPFAEKAPAQVVQKERDKLAALEASAAEISGRLVELA